MKDLTNSQIDRKNILNNAAALKEIYKNLGFYGVMFEGRYRFTKQQIANYFEVDVRTIERLIENYHEELTQSGYEVFVGPRLRDIRIAFEQAAYINDVSDINVGDIAEGIDNEIISPRAPSAAIFTYKAFLNIGMLLTGSDRAREMRGAVLDIVIDVLNKRLGGATKYINQREEEFLPSAIREYTYRQEFTNALDAYIGDNKFKYAQLTDRIYLSIFKEDAKEYRQILNLSTKDSARSTMYSEVLDLVSSYESGFASYLKKAFEKKNEKLRLSEAHQLFKEFEELTDTIYDPLREKARSLMASRDMVFRDALHEKLKLYINSVSSEDFEKFLGQKSRSLEERIEENKEVFKRLKDR
ncbi:hypothetical protein LX64_04628 [Chitinophaga skermanii]|uniref:DNA-binding protein n=1 Tax=Chitinophaga skermanii TaxID=331697 RepID=A0A327Q3P3_9BACT|nr:hypothetical protein [Chitinophaga skermanii]RAI98643.1 hypothetical protein LX64_04628 [Chitinophaga skermanii]